MKVLLIGGTGTISMGITRLLSQQGHELYLLNKKYGYGYCMECCRKQTAADCCKWLTKMYRDKLSKGMCSFKTPHALIESFRYDTLSAKLQKLMQSLITDNGAK